VDGGPNSIQVRVYAFGREAGCPNTTVPGDLAWLLYSIVTVCCTAIYGGIEIWVEVCSHAATRNASLTTEVRSKQ